MSEELPGQADRVTWPAYAAALLEREVVAGDEPSSAADEALATGESALLRALEEETPLALVASVAGLSYAEIRVLAVCGAITLDRRLQRLVATLLADPTGFAPDVDLVVRLLGTEALGTLTPESRLVSSGLLDVEPGVPLAAARVSVPRTVAWALAGELVLDPDLPIGVDLLRAPEGATGGPELVLVHGPDLVRRRQAALSATWGLAFVVTPVPASEQEWRAVVRQATLGGLGVVLELEGPPGAVARRWIGRADHLSWALTSVRALPLEELPDLEFVEVSADHAEVSEGEWRQAYPAEPVPARRPTATQLMIASRVAQPGGGSAMRRLASGDLLAHARRVTPRVGWDDLVLPPAQERQLRAIIDRYRHRSVVHDEWGLDLYPSPGVVALFSGPSGTGKTTSAEVIARELGVEMFRIDLSALVSKYIGETEKNLEQIFSAAHTGNYLLLFDEADSLFGNRSKVEDSKDRYANLEVSYLLQRLETYDGLVVLTSNFQGNIDQAFLRRIHATVHFTIPTAGERERIWAGALAQAPVEDLDLAFVAQQFDITGGSIRNAALAAAFAAAAGGRKIGMVDVLQAVSQELAKLGRRPHEAQFGPWGQQIQAGGA